MIRQTQVIIGAKVEHFACVAVGRDVDWLEVYMSTDGLPFHYLANTPNTNIAKVLPVNRIQVELADDLEYLMKNL